MYGETLPALRDAMVFSGLSPRVRGNLRDIAGSVADRGSIPACTGKPRRGSVEASNQTVYPRVYGETSGSL